jgi:hypothetical protein
VQYLGFPFRIRMDHGSLLARALGLRYFGGVGERPHMFVASEGQNEAKKVNLRVIFGQNGKIARGVHALHAVGLWTLELARPQQQKRRRHRKRK